MGDHNGDAGDSEIFSRKEGDTALSKDAGDRATK
jgi:hypothetical protein